MKKLIFTTAIVLSIFTAKAQNSSYEKVMVDLVSQMQIPGIESSLQALTNKMERIAAAETEEWLPNYWVAYCYNSDSFKQATPDEQDQLLERAESYIEAAENLADDENAEIQILKAQIASARMSIDAMNRYQTYGQVFSSSIQNAKNYDSENPRIYYLEALSAFYTPENYGGGNAIAKPLFEKALEKFETYEIENDMLPNWGLEETHYFLSQID